MSAPKHDPLPFYVLLGMLIMGAAIWAAALYLAGAGRVVVP